MSNFLEIRQVTVRTPNGAGGFSETLTWEYRTKDLVSAVLNVVPLSPAWSPWTRVEASSVVVDQAGNPL